MCIYDRLPVCYPKESFDSVIAVQELIEGKSLAQMVEAGWQPAQKEVERIAHELLNTFSYLQQQQVWTIACVSQQALDNLIGVKGIVTPSCLP